MPSNLWAVRIGDLAHNQKSSAHGSMRMGRWVVNWWLGLGRYGNRIGLTGETLTEVEIRRKVATSEGEGSWSEI